jgi:glycosyltransferase involved in cell wall biosynthesis
VKIGIDAREIQNQITGIGRYLLNFLQEAVERENSHVYYLYYDAPPKNRFQHARVKNIVLPNAPLFVWDNMTLPMAIKRDRIDVFFSPYYKLPFFLSCPSVITVHDLGPLYVPEYDDWKGRFYRLYFKRLVRSSVRKATMVILVSHYSKRCLQEMGDIDDGKLKVVHNCINNQYRPVSENGLLERTKKRYGIQDRYILYTGNMNPHKNVSGLIHAYSKLNHGLCGDFQLVIAGNKNRYFRSLQAQVARLNLGGHVIFTGHVADDELLRLYSGAALFVFPSLYEGFGLPPLEAMACGTPVVSSKATSLEEVIGDAGVLVSPGDVDEMSKAIESVLTDENLRQTYIRRGFARAGEFRMQDNADEILKVIDSAHERTLL